MSGLSWGAMTATGVCSGLSSFTRYCSSRARRSKRVSYVDLRYESGASVGWAPVLVDPQALGGQQNSNQQQNQAQAKQQ